MPGCANDMSETMMGGWSSCPLPQHGRPHLQSLWPLLLSLEESVVSGTDKQHIGASLDRSKCFDRVIRTIIAQLFVLQPRD